MKPHIQKQWAAVATLVIALSAHVACLPQDVEDWATLARATSLLKAPAAIPEQVQRVLADPEAFAESSHPLIGTTPGTIVDDLDALDGCWAHFRSAESPGVDTFDDGPFRTAIDVMVFDSNDSTVVAYTYSFERLSGKRSRFPPGPGLTILRGHYRQRGAHKIEITYTVGQAGVVLPDGSLELDPAFNLSALIHLDDPRLLMTTVSGEYMNVYYASEEQNFSDLDADSILPWTNFYIRLECDQSAP